MTRPTRIVVSTAVRAATLFAIWLWLDDNVSEPELLTGAGVAVIATVVVLMAGRLRSVHAHLRPGMLGRLHRPLTLLVTDSVRVTWALVKLIVLRRGPQSRFRAVRYRATGAGSETDVARRVLSEWGASVAPNRYAVGIDVDSGHLIVHELVPARGPLDPMELG